MELQERELIGGWRKEELHNLYSSPNIFRVIKSQRMGYAGNVVYMAETKDECKIFVGNPKRTNHLGEIGMDRMILLT
jgi:hypothetical protein